MSEAVWVVTAGIVASASAVTLAMLKFAKSNDNAKRLEFMKKLESYDSEIIRFRGDFEQSPKKV